MAGGSGSLWASWLQNGTYPADAGNGFANRRWRLALALVAFGNAVDAKAKQMGYPRWCLGTRGDTRHITEAKRSEHNGNVLSQLPADVGQLVFLILAIDIIEEVAQALDLDDLWARIYGTHNPVIYPKGYVHHNSRITDWDAGDGSMRVLAGDDGHFHGSLNQGDYPGGRDGYLAVMDQAFDWFGDGHTTSGSGAAPIEGDELSMATLADVKAAARAGVLDLLQPGRDGYNLVVRACQTAIKQQAPSVTRLVLAQFFRNPDGEGWARTKQAAAAALKDALAGLDANKDGRLDLSDISALVAALDKVEADAGAQADRVGALAQAALDESAPEHETAGA